MNAFEFVFSLFGLLLGLSLVEVLSGFVRTVKARKHIRLGWLTPMLALFVMLDLVSFWDNAWEIRNLVPAHAGSLFAGLFFTGSYYFAASLVFPDREGEYPDLDVYFFEHRRQVLGTIFVIQLIVLAWLTALNPGSRLQVEPLIIQLLYFSLLALAFWSKRPRVIVGALGGLVAIFLLLALLVSLVPQARPEAPSAAGSEDADNRKTRG